MGLHSLDFLNKVSLPGGITGAIIVTEMLIRCPLAESEFVHIAELGRAGAKETELLALEIHAHRLLDLLDVVVHLPLELLVLEVLQLLTPLLLAFYFLDLLVQFFRRMPRGTHLLIDTGRLG